LAKIFDPDQRRPALTNAILKSKLDTGKRLHARHRNAVQPLRRSAWLKWQWIKLVYLPRISEP
jgi:hypothetical protein